MSRIFTTLAILNLIGLATAFVLGYLFGDASSPENAGTFAFHFLFGFGALAFATLVHSFVLTYFIGTGRWMEETTLAYSLAPEYYAETRSLKLKVLPPLMLTILGLILTGAAGAAADPAATMQFAGFWGLSPGLLHAWTGGITIAVNLLATAVEFWALNRNGLIVARVMQEVRAMRLARGLEV